MPRFGGLPRAATRVTPLQRKLTIGGIRLGLDEILPIEE